MDEAKRGRELAMACAKLEAVAVTLDSLAERSEDDALAGCSLIVREVAADVFGMCESMAATCDNAV